jgi:hypothetical protein
MIDPLITLALTLHHNKGTHALLLGSGISRAAGIPTGWNILEDLIQKIAHQHGPEALADCQADPADWYRRQYRSTPNYSALLDSLAPSQSERQALLRSYFELTDEERQSGDPHLKRPTRGHRAIARLVASGNIRLILTTNFDRLLETALEELNLSPTVISTPDQIQGARPLVHNGVTLIKLHGDYRDTRIKNTDLELSAYAPILNDYLHRILDEFGLIICGWSAEWDTALFDAITRAPGRRYTAYWTIHAGQPSPSSRAQSLITHRQAAIIPISSADSFFDTLAEKVRSLAELDSPHPLNTKIAVATLKRYLPDPTAKIRLHDLIHETTETLYSTLHASTFKKESETVQTLLNRYYSQTEPLLALIITGCYWGGDATYSRWIHVLRRISGALAPLHSHDKTDHHLFPSLLLVYGAGLAALASGNHALLAAVLTVPLHESKGEPAQLGINVYPGTVLPKEAWQQLPGLEKKYFPWSHYLSEKLRSRFHEYLPIEADYIRTFNRFEYLFGLIYADIWQLEPYGGGWWGPVGRFAWMDHLHDPQSPRLLIEQELEKQGSSWPPLQAGLFGGSLERARNSKAQFDMFLRKLNYF